MTAQYCCQVANGNVSTSAAIKPMTAVYHREVPLLSSVSTPDDVYIMQLHKRQTDTGVHVLMK